MKKFIFLLCTLLLSVTIFAQQAVLPETPLLFEQIDNPLKKEMRQQLKQSSPPRESVKGEETTKALAFSAGFEGTTGVAIPPGWTMQNSFTGTITSTTNGAWMTTGTNPRSGTRAALINLNAASPTQNWGILWSPDFTLTGGVTYEIELWYYWGTGTNTNITDNFEVYLMKTELDGEIDVDIATVANIGPFTGQTPVIQAAWTRVNVYVTAPVTGTDYYLEIIGANLACFGYTGYRGGNLRVDDIAINSLPDYAVKLNVEFPYSQIPTNQPITHKAKVTNLGAQTLTNVVVPGTFNGASIGSQSVASLPSITTANLTYTPPVNAILGNNTLAYSVTSTQGATDNATDSFLGTPNTFATDNGTFDTYYGSNSSNATYGNVYTFTKPTKLCQVEMYLYNYSGLAAHNFNLVIFEMTGPTTINTTAIHTQTVARPVVATSWVAYNVTGFPVLPAGSYFICVQETVSNRISGVLGNSLGSRAGSAFGRSGTTANLLPYTGNLCLRLNVDLPDNDIKSIANGFPYTQIPRAQAGTLPFPNTSGKAQNLGLVDQTNVKLTTVYNGTTLGVSTPIASLPALTTSADMTVTTPAGTVFPTTLSTNNVVYTVSQDQTDANPANNTQTYTFNITNDTYAIDDVVIPTTNGVGGGAANARLGNFFTIVKPTKLSKVIVGFSTATTTMTYSLLLYNVTNPATYAISSTPIFTVSNLSRPSGGGSFTIDVPETLLDPGTYFLCVREPSPNTALIGVAYDGVPGRVCYYVGNGTGTTLNPQLTFGSLMIRMVMSTHTINASAGANGSITPSGAVSVNSGMNQTFNFAPTTTGYYVKEVLVNDVNNPGAVTAGTYIFEGVITNHTIHVTFDNTYTLSFNATPQPNPASQTVTYGMAVGTLPNPTPPAGHTFGGWFIGTTQITSTYVWNYASNQTAKAKWIPIDYILTLNPMGGTVNPSSMIVHYDSLVGTMPVPVLAGYNFSGWFTGINGAGTQISATTKWTTLGGGTVNAYWTPKTYTLKLDPGTGTCSQPSVSVIFNAPISNLPSATQTGCTFVGWFLKGGNTQVSLGDTWIWATDTTAVARFKYPITASANPPTMGTISPSGTTTYDLGNTPAFTCTPNSGYYIVSVVVDGVTVWTGTNGVTAPYTYTFPPINKAHTIVVNYAVNCYSMNPGNVIPAGVTVTMSPANCVPHGSPVTFTFTTNCKDITSATVGGTPVTLPTYTIANVTGPLPLIVVNAVTPQYAITATGSNDMGSITPSGTTMVTCGDNITYNLIPVKKPVGHRVSALYIDDVSVPVPVSNSYTFTNVKGPHTIHVEFEEWPQYIIQFGPDISQHAGGVVYPTLEDEERFYVLVDSGFVSYPFTIKADDGYEIDKVYVDGFIYAPAAQTGTYEFKNINSNHTIYATFKPIMFTINATTTAGGTINPTGVVQVPKYSDPTFTIVANVGYHLVDVLVDGISKGAINTYTFDPITENHTIHAIFAINTYKIIATHGDNGTISPADTVEVDYGTNKTFNFTPATGYKVAQVLVDGLEVAAVNNSYTFYNISGDHTIKVTFTKQTFTITSISGPNGTIYPLGVKYVDYWDHSEIYAFEPAAGYHIKQVLVDGKNDPLAVFNKEHRFMNVTENHTIHVFFAKNEFTITATATQGGSISPSGMVTVPNGADKQFFFSPAAGYHLVRVLVDGIEDDEAVSTGTYIFPDVSEDHTISAQFGKSVYDVNLPDMAGVYVVPTNGSTSPVNYGGKYTFEVGLNEGYTQSKSNIIVSANGIVIHPVAGTYTISNITVDQFITIEGVALNTYKIVAKAEHGGNVLPAGTFTVTHGDSKGFEIKPNATYLIDYVKVNGESVGAVSEYTFENIKSDATLVAYFKYGVGIDPNNLINITVFSNHNVVTIENKDLVPVKQVEIMDMYGRLVWTGVTTGTETKITLNVATGVYAVRIITEANDMATTKVSITK